MRKNVKNFTEDVLKSSGKIAIKYFRKNNGTESKKDGSLVTKADREIEHFIRLNIKKYFPDHAILGEEFGFEKAKNKTGKKYTWVIDPIDGTSSFVAGRPLFGMMLGLLEDEKPILGAVYQPVTEELWLGYKGKTYFNGKQIRATEKGKNKKTKTKNLTIATTSPHLLDKKGLKKWDKLRKNAKSTIYGGDCYNYCLLASGFIDAVYEQNLKPHDYLPLLPILTGAGISVDLKVHDDNTADIMAVR